MFFIRYSNMSDTALFDTSTKADWKNIRVNDITIDGSVNIGDGSVDIDSYDEIIVPATFEGTFLQGNISNNIKFNRLGNRVMGKLKYFNVDEAHINASGNVYILIPDLPDSYKPADIIVFPLVMSPGADVNLIGFAKYYPDVNRIDLYPANSDTFTKVGTTNWKCDDSEFSWLV